MHDELRGVGNEVLAPYTSSRRSRSLPLSGVRGFSLLELVVAMTIMGVLLARGIPTATGWVQNSQIRTAAEAVQNGLQVARQQAIQLNTKVKFALTGSDWAITVVNSATAIQSRVNIVDTPNASVSGSQTEIVFNGLGRVSPAPTGPIFFNVTNPKGGDCAASGSGMRCMNVTVQSGGQIRMCDPKLPLADPQSC